MKTVLSICLLLLVGCAGSNDPLTPFQCRVTGVAVEDGDTVTGTIVEEIHYGTINQAKAACYKPFSTDDYGCVVALNEGEYRVVYTSPGFNNPHYASVVNHERCHAYYEEWTHM